MFFHVLFQEKVHFMCFGCRTQVLSIWPCICKSWWLLPSLPTKGQTAACPFFYYARLPHLWCGALCGKETCSDSMRAMQFGRMEKIVLFCVLFFPSGLAYASLGSSCQACLQKVQQQHVLSFTMHDYHIYGAGHYAGRRHDLCCDMLWH